MAWAGTKGLPTTGGRSASSLGLQALLCHSTTVLGCSSDEELVRVAERAGVLPTNWAEMAKWRSRVGSSLAEAAVPDPLQDLLRELHARACVFYTARTKHEAGRPTWRHHLLFAMWSALQHIRDDRRSRGQVRSVPVYPLEPPMPTPRRAWEISLC